MTHRPLQVLVALALLTAGSFAAKERVIRFQNHVRLGYEDNIYQTADKVDSVYITDVINLSGKFNFSSRTDALVYWEPEFQYRFDADPKMITYQNLYGRLNHAMSQRAFLTLSDRFRYQQKEGQTGGVNGGPDEYNQNYIENDLLGAIDYTLNDVSYLKLGAGYLFRVWDDSDYGKWQEDTQRGGNDFNQITADGSYFRQMTPNRTQLMGGVNYAALAYDGDRGGYDSTTLLVGVDQNFNKNLNGFGRFGYSMTSIDNLGEGDDTSTPYLSAGLKFNPSARTSLTSGLGYSVYRSENSVYNAQDRFNFSIGARHDITAKIALSGTFNYTYSFYDSAYAKDDTLDIPDAKDQFVSLGLRCSYQVNRNNFLEAGYLFRTRLVSGSDALSEWDSNRIDCAWRLRL